ncbi:NADPH-dependent 7-cyano-7-deazaguanine reductase QueF [Acidithiobacillus thiooxidans]|jgi:7-cyano-7-deazaguanine reductase|uniref:NADPH-dependent 7-cyano-7-deazaguanine reductase n=2 Tax=Acidithiobacillus TaxID=119977 RepID=A0A543Q856_ACITH|nr:MULTISPECIES: preQ(1) synthase [Acidithiobacillus]MBE7567677.1 NADPH-dependent 7-cyano-7-deazaguanine reductase QueF [Acidithiobacillus sp. HP-11]MBU2737949.1 NADPH-dependent 7-cyano-7-deazaguanine reductase QueF [Acidithiobacillus concretivorus]MBU2741003.1 NADPH-dependent 7-cyano-7-deazaguanine reductase QueF [Acidithiobacillus albertensis]MBU2751652.1 NADPH-dependent 7-cyano-7-deazaguanine reductase QueF [Acidithiobacillus thiooxidans]MBU2793424.1 NADPH-dependent 7-cyano-7-deazaguanine r
MPSQPSKSLERFPNPHPERDYVVHMDMPEFTCLCPLTGQPDFAHFMLDFIPDQHNVELKSLKLYLWSFRDEGAFHEAMSNRIADDIIQLIQPRYLRLLGRWYVRGGISTDLLIEHRQPGWDNPDILGQLPGVQWTRQQPGY